MQFSYILVDQSEHTNAILEYIKEFDEFLCVSVCASRNEAVNKILELRPNLVFLSLSTITNELDSISFFSSKLILLPSVW